MVSPRCRGVIDANGELKAEDGTSDFELWGNDTIAPSNTAYDVILAPEGVVTQTVLNLLISGTTYDLSEPVFAPEQVLSPEYATSYSDIQRANILPAADDVYSIGAQGLRWAVGYFAVLYADMITGIVTDYLTPGSTEAAIDSNTPTLGRLFHTTDEDKSLWMGNGTRFASLTGRVVNIQALGADPTGVVDATAIIQAAIDSLPTRSGSKYGVIYCPRGDYKITGEITCTEWRGVTFKGDGLGATRFVSDNAVAYSMFRVWGCRECVFEGFSVIATASDPLTNGFTIETKSGFVSTHNIFSQIDVEGSAPGGIQYCWRGIAGTGGDNNNDGMVFLDVEAHNWDIAAWGVDHRQAKGWSFDKISATSAGDYIWKLAFGSVTIIDAQCANADIVIYSGDSNGPGIVVIGGSFENCPRFLETAGPSGADMAVDLIGVRFDTDTRPGDDYCILYQFKGPLNVQGGHFVDTTYGAMKVGVNFSSGIGAAYFQNNFFGTSATDPFTDTVGVEQFSNLVKLSGVAAVARLPNRSQGLNVRSGWLQYARSSANASSSGGDTTLSATGNVQLLAATATSNGLSTTNVVAGCIQFLEQTSGVTTVKHNTAPSAGFAKYELQGATDFLMAVGEMLVVQYTGTVWREIARRQLDWATPLGTSTSRATLGGTAEVNTTAVGNVGVGEDDLITYTMPANALGTNGDFVKIRAWGTTANNANAKVVKLYFGTTFITLTLTASQNDTWIIDATIVRVASNGQEAIGSISDWNAGTPQFKNFQNGSLAQDLTAAVVIKCTGEATDNNDIVQEGLVVEYGRNA